MNLGPTLRNGATICGNHADQLAAAGICAAWLAVVLVWEGPVPATCGPGFEPPRSNGLDQPPRPTPAPLSAGARAVRLRVATFNIHQGRGRDRRFDLERTAACLAGYDFVALQEVGVRQPAARAAEPNLRHPRANQAEWLGNRLGLTWLFAPAERDWWGPHFGNGALAAVAVDGWDTQLLPRCAGTGFRNLLRVRARVGETEVTILVAHLDRWQDRARHLQAVWDDFERLPPPVVLLGDLNTRPTDPAMARRLVQAEAIDCLAALGTDPAPQRVDWILVRGGRCVASGADNSGASDHPRLWAELEFPQAIRLDTEAAAHRPGRG